MEPASGSGIRGELAQRRVLLTRAIGAQGKSSEFSRLLQEVDAALAKVDSGRYGMCEICAEPIEADRLATDPLVRHCLDHLSSSERDHLERDLTLAHQVQSALLPTAGFAASGWTSSFHYEPAGSVSGDYLDVFVCPGNADRFAFFVGDVAGKGVAASLLMSQLHAIFRSLMVSSPPLGVLLEQANRLFCERTSSRHFATLVAGFAASTGEVEICNAGHCPPIVLRQGKLETLNPTTFPLGMFCRDTFTSTSIQLRPGDTLVLYTDGVTEARDTRDVLYGEERLYRLLEKHSNTKPAEITKLVMHDVDDYRVGAGRIDDITLLVLHFE